MELIFILPAGDITANQSASIKRAYRQAGIDAECIFQSDVLFKRRVEKTHDQQRLYCIAFNRNNFVSLVQWMESVRKSGFKGNIVLSIKERTFDFEVIPKFLACGGSYIVESSEWMKNPLLLNNPRHSDVVEDWLYNRIHQQSAAIYNDDALVYLYQRLFEEESIQLSSLTYIYGQLNDNYRQGFLSFIKDRVKTKNGVSVRPVDVDFQGEGIIAVWDNPQHCCELGIRMALETKKKVLLLDLDRLNPQFDFHCPPKRANKKKQARDLSGIQKIHMGNQSCEAYDALCMEVADVPTLNILYGSSDLKKFEYFTNDALIEAFAYFRRRYDVILINVNSFIYDAYTCLGLLHADLVIMPTKGELTNIRHYHRSLLLLQEKQKLAFEKCFYLFYDFDTNYDNALELLTEMIHGAVIGWIPSCPKRRQFQNFKKAYGLQMTKRLKKDYKSLLTTLNMEVL